MEEIILKDKIIRIKEIYSACEYDFVLKKEIGASRDFNDLEEAKTYARKIAEQWCEGEKPGCSCWAVRSDRELIPLPTDLFHLANAYRFRGESDFGTVVIPRLIQIKEEDHGRDVERA